MKNEMCVYQIPTFPYVAVGNIHKQKRGNVFVKNTKGKSKKVDALYIGPFDFMKVCLLGALISKCCQEDTNISNDILISKLREFFTLDSTVATA